MQNDQELRVKWPKCPYDYLWKLKVYTCSKWFATSYKVYSERKDDMFEVSSWLEQVWNLNRLRTLKTSEGNTTRIKTLLEPSKELLRNLWPSRTTHARMGSYGYKCKFQLMSQENMDLRNLHENQEQHHTSFTTTQGRGTKVPKLRNLRMLGISKSCPRIPLLGGMPYTMFPLQDVMFGLKFPSLRRDALHQVMGTQNICRMPCSCMHRARDLYGLS